MLKTIIGLILLAFPFLLIPKYKDKKIGFIQIFSILIGLHLLVALVTQALGVFTYQVVLTVNIVISTIILIKADLRKYLKNYKITINKIDWVCIFVLVLSFFYLYQVHNNYSGKYSTIKTRELKVENMSYPYPYYSDEWYAIAFIKDSIETKSLPLKNPLLPWHVNFSNLELATHTFLSEIILLTDLNPIIDYTKVAILVNMTIIFLIYLLLRRNKVNKLSSAIASLSILYVTNGATLPGIWYLLPINLGIITLLLSFIFLSSHQIKMTLFMSFLTLLFYPPLFVFYFTAIIVYLFTSQQISRNEKLKILSYFLLLITFSAILVSSIYFLSEGKVENFINYILFNKLIHPTFTPKAIPQYSILNVIPISILFFVPFGLLPLLKKNVWILATFTTGIVYWLVYSTATYRFIIEYERAIFVTSILTIVVVGFGLDNIIRFLKETYFFKDNNLLSLIQVSILGLFVLLSSSYTKRENWQKLTLTNLETNEIFLPEAPANKYLQPDDLKIFKTIKKKSFLSLPWKETVIGIATDNYPVITKKGTLSIKRTNLSKFINSDCIYKSEVAKKLFIEYFYLPQFDCPNFEFIDKSSEGLHLYKFTDS